VGAFAARFARANAWRSRILSPPPSPPSPPAVEVVRTEAVVGVAPPRGLNAEGEHAFFERLGIGDDLGMRLEEAWSIAVEEAWSAHRAEEERSKTRQRAAGGAREHQP
jgi:hypothetical protein